MRKNERGPGDATASHDAPSVRPAREAELATGLARVEERVARACDAAGRSRSEVTLIVVTKTYPAEDVRLLAGLGVRDFAENKDQEAAAKAAALADLPLTWHFVGQLQTNKARSVTAYADYVHSVDRVRLVDALARAVAQRERAPLNCLIQVALEEESGQGGGRGGVDPAGVAELAAALAAAPGLRLAGLMAVAPLTGGYAGAPGAAFERLMEIAGDLRLVDPAANMVSAGMSADLEEAIIAGATHVRVGSAVLGVRPALG
ncbi:YggS family pyridoxal phosphate-dependent enzyme [Streptomyces hainanensis]|uniref:Pyridoxal phosphate homeostasis protein n=1 Tax=Streptomyces hainanensis TaxID=402648 RepID=A0A4R4SZP0_9ACTN|nr:YggS family pyridoxal phosphate-dependent enzyme [Streptomyces hainanensis]TDC69880.1 YggS family pyridoxal phosphate-dependent enzyme [Streptomyces hainanensis]